MNTEGQERCEKLRVRSEVAPCVSDVGEIVGVSGNTITSRKGSWIFVWDKNGKKISSRSAN